MQMMHSSDYETLNKQVHRNQRKALIRTITLSIAAMLFTITFLIISFEQLRSAREQLHEAQYHLTQTTEQLKVAENRVHELKKQVQNLTSELNKTETLLLSALDLAKYIHPLGWDTFKTMSVGSPHAGDILTEILHLKDDTRWGLGESLQGGYTSPGFANLVLTKLHYPTIDKLQRSTTDTPQPGDIVMYKGGYYLFFFGTPHDRNGWFVAGMTPFGVIALDYDFGVERIGIIRVRRDHAD